MFIAETPRYSTKKFTWSSKCRTFITEASDLGWIPGRVPTAIVITSHKTGRIAAYSCARTDVDAEGEVSAWVYVVSDPTIASVPELAETSIIVFND